MSWDKRFTVRRNGLRIFHYIYKDCKNTTFGKAIHNHENRFFISTLKKNVLKKNYNYSLKEFSIYCKF